MFFSLSSIHLSPSWQPSVVGQKTGLHLLLLKDAEEEEEEGGRGGGGGGGGGEYRGGDTLTAWRAESLEEKKSKVCRYVGGKHITRFAYLYPLTHTQWYVLRGYIQNMLW